ncbi:MAG: adenylate/guanylate cyclase domain-containing protein [Chloroflexi bacterium]|nr:adenylate/guanylate cyclase domain-containing protein [Chloroflexota bacterium]
MPDAVNAEPPRYARAGDLHIAYRVVGDGPIDLVLVDQWFSNVDAMWEFPPLARLLTQLASFSRLIVFDKRGTGLSDPIAVDALPTIEEWIDDLRAVLDDAGSTRTALLSGIGASVMSLMFAATYPERTSSLVLVDGCARLAWADDYPSGQPVGALERQLEWIRAGWGKDGGTMAFLAPNLLLEHPVAEQYIRYERQSASPGMAKAMIGWLYEVDVRHVLPAISVPTLLLHHVEADRIAPIHGRYIAERIQGAQFVEIPGRENYTWAGDTAPMLAEIQEFLTGERPVAEPDRVLATVLFTDMVDSTRRAAELGDAGWRKLLAAHDQAIRSILERFRGREIKTTGDGFLATFDGPARAIRATIAIRGVLAAQGIAVRSGLHTGEVEIVGRDIAGIAVHIASRIGGLARPGEVLVSSTVKDLVAGSGIIFEARGAHALRGIEEEWRLFAASEPA